tara:strand:- start:4835 stop:4966 length:132 start_codon:yes stop_codon:yes gene_type:complete
MKEMKKYRHRSAISGHYVTKKYAESHPKTTVKEKIQPKKGGKK